MTEQKAQQLARLLGGEVRDTGGGVHLVVITRDDGSLVVISGDVICLYANEDAFDAGAEITSIALQ